jgi:hypothetical protein
MRCLKKLILSIDVVANNFGYLFQYLFITCHYVKVCLFCLIVSLIPFFHDQVMNSLYTTMIRS